MTNKKIQLEEAEKKLSDLILNVNINIEYLGITSGKLFEVLNDLQKSFDLIRGLPDDEIKKYKEIKMISSSWEQQAEIIQKEYDKFLENNVIAGAAGGALGVAVALVSRPLAMGVASTFGVASTGTAISALSGVAAKNAALAWLGGGTLATGGSGIAGGQALLGLAGPIGWSLVIASLVTFGFLYYKGRSKKERLEDIFLLISKRDYLKYKLAEIEIKEKVHKILNEIANIVKVNQKIKTFGLDYHQMDEEQQYELGTYVNMMLAALEILIKPIDALVPKFSIEDFNRCIPLPYLEDNTKNLIVSLANFFYSIELSEDDIDLLYGSFSKNDKFLKSVSLTKGKFEKLYLSRAVLLNSIINPNMRIK